jgi:aromatic-L-amino-acid decarboxylase
VDAAYAGPAAILPEMRWIFRGVEDADSVVINPHKWLFTPMDLSTLFCRRLESVRDAFSLLPEYLRTVEAGAVRNHMDYGPQLGRRFRALKLWFVIRAFGVEGIRERLREHIRLAQQFAGWIDADPAWERMAPTPFSTVCFRAVPTGTSEEERDVLNERIMEAVNAGGEAYLSHTKLHDRFTLRLAIGNLRTEERHVRRAWELLREALRNETAA